MTEIATQNQRAAAERIEELKKKKKWGGKSSAGWCQSVCHTSWGKGWHPDGTAYHQIKHAKEATQRKNGRIATGEGGTEEKPADPCHSYEEEFTTMFILWFLQGCCFMMFD